MKKILSLFMAILLICSIAACGNKPANTTISSNSTNETTPPNTTDTTVTTNTTGTTNSTANPNTTGTTNTTATPGTTNPPIIPTGEFDDDNIVLSFGAISDIHLEREGSLAKFKKALSQLEKNAALKDKDGLDAVVVVGDMVERRNQISDFKNVFEQSGLEIPLLFTLGNHDQEIGEALKLSDFYNVLGSSYFKNDVESPDLSSGNRHCVVNGYHFVFVQPSSYYSNGKDRVTFDKKTVEWLDTTLSKITKENPNEYVFVFTHSMISDTCYGSNYKGAVYGGSDSYWYTDDLTDVMNKYPQAVTFSGHLHFPINDERSIMQTNFTAIGCGSVSYMAIENEYNNVTGAKTTDSAQISAGHLVQVDKNGNVKITRLDFTDRTTFKTPWIIETPNSENTHLNKYTAARGTDGNSAPVMDGKAQVNTSKVGSLLSASLTFETGKDDDLIHHYKITVKDADSDRTVKRFTYLSDFYKYATPDKMSKEMTISLGALNVNANYVVEIVAVDSWGLESEPLKVTVKTSSEEEETSSLPEAYSDIDFAGGKATDSKGNLNISIKGATVGSAELTFGGKTKNIEALTVTAKGQYAIATFRKYSTSNISSFYNNEKGFSVEALYVNRAPSGTQGIFCGTQQGGFGLATTDDGKPGICAYIGGASYYYTKDSNVASKTELTHVVATVVTLDGTTYTSVFVNGELVASDSKKGSVYVGKSTNSFGIGGDTDSKGGAADFPMTDFSIADLKIYKEALNKNQVKTAYNNALALFN